MKPSFKICNFSVFLYSGGSFFGDRAPDPYLRVWMTPPPIRPPPPLSEGLDLPLLYVSEATRTNFFKISSHDLHNV